jgi:hypothetical protein
VLAFGRFMHERMLNTADFLVDIGKRERRPYYKKRYCRYQKIFIDRSRFFHDLSLCIKSKGGLALLARTAF